MSENAKAVEMATKEYLLHRGENPYFVLPGGAERWETHVPAMRAALAVFSARHPEASDTDEAKARRSKALDELGELDGQLLASEPSKKGVTGETE